MRPSTEIGLSAGARAAGSGVVAVVVLALLQRSLILGVSRLYVRQEVLEVYILLPLSLKSRVASEELWYSKGVRGVGPT